MVDYEPLPFVLDGEEALKDGAPQLHDTVPNNLVFRASYGDKAQTEQAIASAEVVVRQRIRSQRMIANTIETRGSIGSYDETTGDYTLWTNVQPLYPVRLLIAAYVLGIPYNKLRVIAPAIGVPSLLTSGLPPGTRCRSPFAASTNIALVKLPPGVPALE